MKPKCCMCKKRFNNYGAILLSPPNTNDLDQNVVSKYHICCKCYDKMVAFIWSTENAGPSKS